MSGLGTGLGVTLASIARLASVVVETITNVILQENGSSILTQDSDYLALE